MKHTVVILLYTNMLSQYCGGVWWCCLVVDGGKGGVREVDLGKFVGAACQPTQ